MIRSVPWLFGSARSGLLIAVVVLGSTTGGRWLLTERSGAEIEYLVHILETKATVQARLHGWKPGARLRFGSRETYLGISHLRFADKSGTPIAENTTVEGEGETAQHWHVPQTMASTVQITYEVAPTPIADPLRGWKFRYGTVSETSAALSGRHLFLLPDGLSFQRVRVRFELPRDWRLNGPMKLEVDGQDLNRLLSRRFVAGPFDEQTIPGTQWSLRLHPTYSAEIRHALREAAILTSCVLTQNLPGLGEAKTEIYLAPSPKDSVGVGWMEGSRVLYLDTNGSYPRLWAEVARHVVRAFSKGRGTDGDEGDWFADGAGEWAADRVVSTLDRSQIGVVENQIRRHEKNSSDDRDIVRPGPEVHSLDGWRKLRISKAATLLFLLDKILRDSGHPDGLWILLRRWTAGESWERALEAMAGAATLGRVRSYAAFRGFPFERLEPIRFEAAPRVIASKPDRELALSFSGFGRGYLEACGCTKEVMGGLARRAGALRKIQQGRPDLLSIDLGNFLTHQAPRALDPLHSKEQELYVDLLGAIGTDVAVVGQGELLRGTAFLETILKRAGFPCLSSNVTRDGSAFVPSSVILERGGTRIGIVGYSEPWLDEEGYRLFGENLTGFDISGELSCLAEPLEKLQDACDLIIVAGRLSPAALAEVLQRYGNQVDLILNEDPSARKGAPVHQRALPGGFVGRTLVLFHVFDESGLSSALLRAGRRQIYDFTFDVTFLDGEVPEDRSVRARIDAFYEEQSHSVYGAQHRMFESDPWVRDAFIDESSCVSCHAGEVRQWNTTRHAKAFKTLMQVQRQYHPSCVKCHVTGFGWETGYRMDKPVPERRNVQCQACHGVARDHVQNPKRGNIRRTPTRETCMECHDAKHDPTFESRFGDAWQRVTHGSAAGCAPGDDSRLGRDPR